MIQVERKCFWRKIIEHRWPKQKGKKFGGRSHNTDGRSRKEKKLEEDYRALMAKVERKKIQRLSQNVDGQGRKEKNLEEDHKTVMVELETKKVSRKIKTYLIEH